MKNKAFLLLLCFLGFCYILPAQDNRLTMSLNQVSLEHVFDVIQNQSEYIIFFKDNQVDLSQKVSVNANNLTIEEILDQILSGTDLKYKIFDRQVILIKDREAANAENILLSNNQIKKRTVVGQVVDSDGVPIQGASVVVKGTHISVVTSLTGNYSIDIPVNTMFLSFSYVGLKSIDEPLKNRAVINISMASDNLDVEEIVVSALGLRRAEKALTYATQTIKADDISRNRDVNFMAGISGKISGLEISKSAAGAGGSTKISLRGNKSLSETSEPLFVIDGIPMVNKKGGQLGMFGGADSGDGLSQINTDDIESMTILKGANAAVLYGSQGANGVILITTKKVNQGQLKGSFRSSFLFEKIMDKPDLQFSYGGVNGSAESWNYTKGDYPSRYVDDFFKSGGMVSNTLTLSGGDRTSVYFSFSNTSIGGIVPGNNYDKYNATFKQTTKLLDDKLIVSTNTMLIQELTKNKNTAGYYANPLTGLYLFPRDKDYAYYSTNYQIFNPTRNLYLQNWHVSDHFQSNPEWIIKNQKREDLTKRIISSLSTELIISDHLNLQLRGNYDYAERTNEKTNKAGSNATNVHPNGSWDYQKYSDELIYGDAILSYSNNFNGLTVDAVLGSSYQKSTYGLGICVSTGTDGLIIPNEFCFQNIGANVQVKSTLDSRLVKKGVFGNVQLGYKEKAFLDFSGRKDWASSLYGTGNDSYFYPSIGVTGIISNLIDLPDFISFGKLRGSYTIVGNEVPFNKVKQNNTITTSGVQYNTTKPFTNLKPEMIHSVELGADWRFFNGLLGIDITLYNIMSKDQFISLPASSGSGYTNYFVNAGEIVNKGGELVFNSVWLKSKDFSWHSSLNFSLNRNKIIALHPDLKDPIVLSDNEGYQLLIKEGGSFGDIYVHKFLRDENNRIKLDYRGDVQKTTKKEYIGNSNPKLGIGLNNSLKYKNLSIDFLLNGKIGGKVVSQTEAMLDGYGVSKRTAEARDHGGVDINAVMPDGEEIHKMDARQYYSVIGDRDGIKEPYTYSRTNIRLAQVTLAYDFYFPKAAIKVASLSLTGQNLFFIYKDAPFDPEITLNTLISDQALDNFSIPSTRTFGFNIQVYF